MEKTIMRERIPFVRVRPGGRNARPGRMQATDKTSKPPAHSWYPPIKLPEQPTGYLKCRHYDCL